MPHFARRVHVPAPAEALFAWHANDGAFERLTPPWERVEVVHRTGPLAEGMRATMSVNLFGPISKRWVAEHVDVKAPRGFTDRQLTGPFARWEHQHRIEPDGDESAWLEDAIDFEPPLPPLGRVGMPFVRAKLARMFDYRHEVTLGDLRGQRRLRELTRGEKRCVAISGASGLLGRTLVPYLTTAGHEVRRLVRRAPRTADEIRFEPEAGILDPSDLAAVDVVIHLAGENVGDGRWSDAKRARILRSRVAGTRLVASALAAHGVGKTLVSASGVGFYGHRGDEAVSEQSPPGDGFLADVCQRWEAETEPAASAGVRVVNARIGVVIAPHDGALGKLLLPFSLGLGGPLGRGDTWMSWIGLQDAVRALALLAFEPRLEGPVNVVAPQPVQNRDFARTLGRVLRRPAFIPLPRAAVELMLGRERARELLFTSTRAEPTQLQGASFTFQHERLELAMRHVLGR